MSKKKAKRFKSSSIGNDCPKCNKPMDRRDRIKPPLNHQLSWFDWYDYCLECKHLQHYEDAKRFKQLKKR